jgi:hypothetical protein
MPNKIKNTFSKLSKDPIQIIKGKEGFNINITDIYVTNNTNYNMFLSIYMIDIKEVKNYIIRNVTIPPKKRFDIPIDSNFEIEYKEYVFAETRKITDLDIFCNYVITEKIISTVNLTFQNQDALVISGINWSTFDSTEGRKIIRFVENERYSLIPDIYYKIDGQKVIIYKTDNLKLPENKFKEFSDRYEIDFYSKEKDLKFINVPSECIINFKTNIVGTQDWRYSVDETASNVWYETNTDVYITPNRYYIEFKEVTGYETSNFLLEFVQNNKIEYNIEYTKTTSYLKINTDYDINNLTWCIIDDFGGEDLSGIYNLTDVAILEAGIYIIRVNTIEDVFEATEYHITLIKNQTHILHHNVTPTNKAILKVTTNSTQTEDIWQFNNIWYSNSDLIEISPLENIENINFQIIDGYTSPNSIPITLSENLDIIINTNYISNLGQISIVKSSLMDINILKSCKWRIISQDTGVKTIWFNYDYIHTTLYGKYYIEIQEIEDYFKNISDIVIVYKNQKTIYCLNNSSI